MSQIEHHILVSFLSLLAIVVSIGGCRSSKQATADEGFFQPLTAVDRPTALKPSKAANAQKPSATDKLADSLTGRQREQGRRAGAPTGQLQLPGTSRKSEKSDSSRAIGTPPVKAPRPAVQPVPGKYEEFLRQYEAGQYKAAADGFRGLLQSGVPKGVEDQYHYMIGLSHFKLRQFDQASASLKTVANWKGSKLRADAYFVLGQIYKQFGASRQAKSMFESVLKESPKADLAQAAREELKELAAKK